MKTQKSGQFRNYVTAYRLNHFDIIGWQLDAFKDFIKNRANGKDCDAPKEKFPKDGRYTWIQGEKKSNGWIYGNRQESSSFDDNEFSRHVERSYYNYELRYEAGPGDLAWFAAKDRNYLRRIFKEGNLSKLEPTVWLLYKIECQKGGDIGKWWDQKLKLPNLGLLLTHAKDVSAYYSLATFWKKAPVEICQLIVEDYLLGDKLFKL